MCYRDILKMRRQGISTTRINNFNQSRWQRLYHSSSQQQFYLMIQLIIYYKLQIFREMESPSETYKLIIKSMQLGRWTIVKQNYKIIQNEQKLKLLPKIIHHNIKKEAKVEDFLNTILATLSTNQKEQPIHKQNPEYNFDIKAQQISQLVETYARNIKDRKYQQVFIVLAQKLNTFQQVLKTFAEGNKFVKEDGLKRLVISAVQSINKINSKIGKYNKASQTLNNMPKMFIQVLRNPDDFDQEYPHYHYIKDYKQQVKKFREKNKIYQKPQPRQLISQATLSLSLCISILLKSQLLQSQNQQIKQIKSSQQIFKKLQLLIQRSNQINRKMKEQANSIQRKFKKFNQLFPKQKIKQFHRELSTLLSNQQLQESLESWKTAISLTIKKKQEQITQKNKEILSLSQELKKKSNNLQNQYHHRVNHKQVKLNSFLTPKSNLNLNQKLFLIDQIEQLTQKNIASTYLLYTYDNKNKINPHQCLDNRPNILMVVRLNSAKLIAAFHTTPFKQNLQPQQLNSKQGLLMNITNQRSYKVKQRKNTKIYIYEKNYIIFGNSDVRVKVSDCQIESFFGESQSTYDDLGKGRQPFMSNFDNQAQFRTCEFFQVIFKDTENLNFEQYQTDNGQTKQLVIKKIKTQDLIKKEKPKVKRIQKSEQKQIEQANKKLIQEKIHQRKQTLKCFQVMDLTIKQYFKRQSVGIQAFSSQIYEIYQKQKEKEKELNSIINQLSMKNQILLKNNQQLNKKYNSIEKYFSTTDLFKSHQKQKQYIVNLIFSKYRKIQSTKLIYKYDLLNKTNFHSYIDHIPNLLLIVKTQNNQILGAYSEQPFQPDKCGIYGFLYAATKQQYFDPNPKSKGLVTSYDSYSVVYGNSQLRIKTLDNILFSNFGIVNNYFQTKNKDVNFLLEQGKGKRETLIDGYQFYQIIYSDNLQKNTNSR